MGLFNFFKKLHNNGVRDQVAIDINVQAGSLQKCPICQDVFDREHTEHLPDAEKEAVRRIETNDPSVACFDGDREDLLKRIHEVRKHVPYECTCMHSD